MAEDNHIEVSDRIKKDYGNGMEYYAIYGHDLVVIPENIKDKP